jgi:hypothetical protein
MGGGGELDSGCGEGWRSARAILTVLAQADGDEFQYFFVRVLGYGGVDRANFSRSHSGCMVVSISITGKFGTSKSVRAHASMYHGCIMMAITMYHSCIIDVMEFVPHISVSLHTLPISCFRPSLLGHPVLGISSPCIWLLVSGDSYGMAAPDMLFADRAACMFEHALLGAVP